MKVKFCFSSQSQRGIWIAFSRFDLLSKSISSTSGFKPWKPLANKTQFSSQEMHLANLHEQNF